MTYKRHTNGLACCPLPADMTEAARSPLSTQDEPGDGHQAFRFVQVGSAV